MSQEECARLREGVPYVKVYRYNPKHLCPKLSASVFVVQFTGFMSLTSYFDVKYRY